MLVELVFYTVLFTGVSFGLFYVGYWRGLKDGREEDRGCPLASKHKGQLAKDG